MFNVIDLFSGCGGLSLGFEKAGFAVRLGVDVDNAALKTFSLNHKKAKAKNIDLSTDEGFSELVNNIRLYSPDVIVAGPPCQGFSVTGPRRIDDPRNSLYLAVIKAVQTFRPQAFLIENVQGMATLYNGQVKDEIVKRLDSVGYNVVYKIVCAADYGVPQIRKRLIIVGLRKELGIFDFPEPILTPENYITCKEAIGDLPSLDGQVMSSEYCMKPFSKYQNLMRGSCNILSNHIATIHSDHVVNVIKLVPPGGNYKNLPPGVGDSRKFHVAWTRYHPDRPSNTIDTGHRNHFHYSFNRVPTIREFARLQSFPDNFIFYGTKTEQNRQVGNAVPPLLGYALAKKLKTYLKNDN